MTEATDPAVTALRAEGLRGRESPGGCSSPSGRAPARFRDPVQDRCLIADRGRPDRHRTDRPAKLGDLPAVRDLSV